DLFSFGVVLYQMATGRPPFTGETDGALLDAILHASPASSLHCDSKSAEELERVISKCLEKDRDLRYQHASEIRTDLRRLQRDTDEVRARIATKPATLLAVAGRWKAVLLGIAVALALSAIGYFYFHRTAKLTDQDTIVLADFSNTTNDPIFDGT